MCEILTKQLQLLTNESGEAAVMTAPIKTVGPQLMKASHYLNNIDFLCTPNQRSTSPKYRSLC